MIRAVIHHVTYRTFRLRVSVSERPTTCEASSPKAIASDWKEVTCKRCLGLKDEKAHRQWPSTRVFGIVQFERGVEPKYTDRP